MSLLTALIVKISDIWSAKNTSYTKLERLSRPNLDFSEKIIKVIIK